MYSHIRQLAEEQDIAGLRLYVETKNSRAQKTYEALGMSSGTLFFLRMDEEMNYAMASSY